MAAGQKNFFHPTYGSLKKTMLVQLDHLVNQSVNMHDEKHFMFDPNLFCKRRFTIFFGGPLFPEKVRTRGEQIEWS